MAVEERGSGDAQMAAAESHPLVGWIIRNDDTQFEWEIDFVVDGIAVVSMLTMTGMAPGFQNVVALSNLGPSIKLFPSKRSLNAYLERRRPKVVR